MTINPTLILVVGSWHSTETWDKISSLLKAQDFRCVPVALPSTAGDANANFKDDVDAVRDSILTETTNRRDVVVVVHSYGGMVGSSAIKSLTKPKQDVGDNKSGHVIGLVMIATGFCKTGLSFLDGFGGAPPPIWRLDPGEFVVLTVPAKDLFYHDLPDEEGNYWVSKLTKQSSNSLTTGGEYCYSGWKDVPVWYLATTEDKALPIEAQKYFVQLAKDSGADVTMKEIESSHSPMLSKPKETVKFIVQAVVAFTS